MPLVTASEQGKAHLRSTRLLAGLLVRCKVYRWFFGVGCAKVAWNGTPESVIVAYRFSQVLDTRMLVHPDRYESGCLGLQLY